MRVVSWLFVFLSILVLPALAPELLAPEVLAQELPARELPAQELPAQERNGADTVSKGHDLAAIICANCHVAASDQRFAPVLNPPAPSFASIAQRPNTDADSLQKFITTTHRGLDNSKGMPNPYLMDYQVTQVVAYILSLRK
jgi:mono/diheme cytochrome c family protein